MTCQEARAIAEEQAGKRLADEEYEKILAYSFHKARINGKDADYVPLLLMDEIKNYFFDEALNARSRRLMEAKRLLEDDEFIHGVMMALEAKGEFNDVYGMHGALWAS